MTFRLPLPGNKHGNIVSAYAPMMTNPDEVKDKIYDDWHLIDYVIVRRTDRQDVRVTKTMCGADCWTDHRLIVSKLNLRIQLARRPQGKKAPKRLDVSKLNHDSMKQAFINDN